MSIELDIKNLEGFIESKDWSGIEASVTKVHQVIENRTGAGGEFLGWTILPEEIDNQLVDELVELGREVRGHSQCIVSIGIGGSYLGIRATEGFLEGTPLPIIYAGNNISADYLARVLDKIKDVDYTVVVISKSGTTTEPALAFRLIKEAMQKKYSAEDRKKRIICVTDAAKGALRKVVDQEGYRSYIIPDDVGGRFSVLTPVGLVPLALAGVDIKGLVEGARRGQKLYGHPELKQNTAYRYAAARHMLYQDKGKGIEMLASFYDNMTYVCEWWKQLFGESEGKDGKGIFPASTILSTDLHSMGQWMQDGQRNIFETFLEIARPKHQVIVPEEADDLDQFNFIAGRDFDFVNKQAYKATAQAHYEGGVPNMTITIDQPDITHLGELYYFFERAVAMSGYLLGVNPFDQPGVEAYKKKMFSLLGRP